MNLSIFKGTSPAPADSGGYTDTTSISIGYNRSIRRASWNVGASYNFDNSTDAGGSDSSDDGNQNSWSLNTSLGMSVFKNSCQASVFASYSDQSGGGSGESFASTSVGFSLSRGF
jgi:outer membrane usher protein FimD/PapC